MCCISRIRNDRGFVEISDEDLEFKQSELKKEQSKLSRKREERDEAFEALDDIKHQQRGGQKNVSKRHSSQNPRHRKRRVRTRSGIFMYLLGSGRWKTKSKG